jgi:ATP-dependent Clp protease ATP-binding subunit ClpA
MTEMEKEFRPEFVNRLDEVIVFNSLSREDLRQIVDLEFGKVVPRLSDREISLELTPAAKDVIIEKGYSADYGARPLRRQVERLLEDPLSEEILQCQIKGPCRIRIEPSPDKDKLVFVPVEEPKPLVAGASGGAGIRRAGGSSKPQTGGGGGTEPPETGSKG